MDESDARGEPVVTATGGVTLEKRLETDEFQQPTVLYELTSQRDVAVDVRLIEPIPPALEPADLGFLGTAEEQAWEIHGPKLVLERTLEPGDTYRTGIAARGDRAGAVVDLLDAPELLEVDEARGDRWPENGESTGSTSPNAEPSGAGPLVERLVDELQTGAVPAETVAALRAELRAPGERPSLETRLDQLQADVADVRAYATTVEGFLDEHGPPNEVVDRLEGRLEEVDDRLASVDATVSERDEEIAALAERASRAETTVEALTADLEDVESTLDRLDAAVERLEREVPTDGDRRLETLEAELAEVSQFTTSLKAAFRE
jgi:hypothetical protein